MKNENYTIGHLWKSLGYWKQNSCETQNTAEHNLFQSVWEEAKDLLLIIYIYTYFFFLSSNIFSEAHFTDIYAEVRFSDVHTLIADKTRSFCRPPHQEVSGSLFLSFCTRILLLWGQILEVQKGAPTARTEPALPAAGQSRSATRR